MLTQDELKSKLHYDQDTGIFTRIIKSGRYFHSESVGSIKDNGYLRISIKSKLYYAHRLAWLYVYGYMPKILDHIDGNRLNSSINNLRQATQLENNCNQKLSSKNKSGVKGLRFDSSRNKWAAEFSYNNKKIIKKRFDSFDDAKNTLIELRKKYQGEFFKI